MHKALWLGVLENLKLSAGTFLDGMDGAFLQGFCRKFSLFNFIFNKILSILLNLNKLNVLYIIFVKQTVEYVMKIVLIGNFQFMKK